LIEINSRTGVAVLAIQSSGRLLMQDFEIILESQPQSGAVFTCRAISVAAALERAAAILPKDQSVEIRSGERCVYRGPLQNDVVVG
jgi:hypothetical protein